MDDVAITIVNYKTKEDVMRCLASLFNDLSDALRIKVVVLDNASGDDIEGMIAMNFPQVTCIVSDKNFGFGAGQNRAMESVDAKYYFLINPDVIFPSEGQVIKKLYEWMEEHTRVGMVAPKLLNLDGTAQHSCYRFPRFFAQPARRLTLNMRYKRAARQVDEFLMKDFGHNRTMPVDWIMGSAMFVRKTAIDQIGGFDSRYFMYFEDCDWCRRFWEVGWPVYYVHDIELMHGHRRASAKIPGLKAVLLNPLTRVHIKSWLKYFWKWRGSNE